MRDDDRFEVSRAMDLLPHVVGASWAASWFRMTGQRRPTREEFRRRAADYLGSLAPLGRPHAGDARMAGIDGYVASRMAGELERVLGGLNGEVEKRYDRYVDYG